MDWGCFVVSGPGGLFIINGATNSAFYHKILKENVHPSVGLQAQVQLDLQQHNQANPPLYCLKEIKWMFWSSLIKVLTWIFLRYCDKTLNWQFMQVGQNSSKFLNHEKSTFSQHFTVAAMVLQSHRNVKFRNPLQFQFKYIYDFRL